MITPRASWVAPVRRWKGGRQSVGKHQRAFWPSARRTPPVAAAPPAASGRAGRLPLRRAFGDKLAKVFPRQPAEGVRGHDRAGLTKVTSATQWATGTSPPA